MKKLILSVLALVVVGTAMTVESVNVEAAKAKTEKVKKESKKVKKLRKELKVARKASTFASIVYSNLEQINTFANYNNDGSKEWKELTLPMQLVTGKDADKVTRIFESRAGLKDGKSWVESAENLMITSNEYGARYSLAPKELKDQAAENAELGQKISKKVTAYKNSVQKDLQKELKKNK